MSKNYYRLIVNTIFIAAIAAGAITSIYMNFGVNRSLWLDEAALAESFSRRSLWNLWDGAFANNQSAPLGWLYIENFFFICIKKKK